MNKMVAVSDHHDTPPMTTCYDNYPNLYYATYITFQQWSRVFGWSTTRWSFCYWSGRLLLQVAHHVRHFCRDVQGPIINDKSSASTVYQIFTPAYISIIPVDKYIIFRLHFFAFNFLVGHKKIQWPVCVSRNLNIALIFSFDESSCVYRFV